MRTSPYIIIGGATLIAITMACVLISALLVNATGELERRNAELANTVAERGKLIEKMARTQTELVDNQLRLLDEIEALEERPRD